MQQQAPQQGGYSSAGGARAQTCYSCGGYGMSRLTLLANNLSPYSIFFTHFQILCRTSIS